jgi:uncharacterized protein
MMTRNNVTLATAVFAALVMTPAAAVAVDSKALVDKAKTDGIVGEQADGFLGFVKPSTDTALRGAVADINAGRAALYREAAAKNGVAVEAAGASAFTAVVQQRLRPGDYYKPAGGAWTRK